MKLEVIITTLLLTLSITGKSQSDHTPLKVDREYAGVNYLQDEALAKSIGLPKTFSGKGVLVAIFDGGFDCRHIAFLDPVTHEGRVKVVYDVAKDITYNTPEGIDTLGVLSTPKAGNDHGCHVAGIATGSYDGEEGLRGVAPEATVMIVRGDLDDNYAQKVFDRIDEVADSLDLPCVVNISLNHKSSGNLSQFETHMDFHDIVGKFTGNGTKPGRIVCMASGNTGKLKGEAGVKHTFTSNDETIYLLSLGLDTNPDSFSQIGNLTAHSTDMENTSISIDVYDIENNCVVEDFTITDWYNDKEYTTSEELTSLLKSKFDVYGNEFIFSDKDDFWGMGTSKDNLALRYSIKGSKGSTITIESSDLNNYTPDGFTTYNYNFPFTKIPYYVCTTNAISVGNVASRDIEHNGVSYTPGMICHTSCWGQNMAGQKFPDVCAPGVELLSSVALGVCNDLNPLRITNPYPEWSATAYDYVPMTGTSMASPFMTGMTALMLEYDPTLTVNRLRNLLYKTNDWNDSCLCEDGATGGNGILNAKNLMLALIEESQASGIYNMNAETSENQKHGTKFFENGNLVIVKNNKRFNTLGQRIK